MSQITPERFELALKQLTGSDWAKFERLSSIFLAAEFPDVRTMASPSGDGGRDSELFSPQGLPYVVLQYSVQDDWAGKIRGTVKRLKSTFPEAKTLIYMSNRAIGADADALKAALMREQIMLDVRDRSWFIERMNSDVARSEAAIHISREMVDPLLESHRIETRLVGGLSIAESRTALMFLEMQSKDADKAYGFTKSSFDALVRAALRGTDTEYRLSRKDVHDAVCAFLPQHARTEMTPRIDASLLRLTGKAVRWRKDKDEFHLNDAERERLADSAATIDALRSALEEDIADVLKNAVEAKFSDFPAFMLASVQALETYYLKKGQEFAEFANAEQALKADQSTLRDVVVAATKGSLGVSGRNATELMLSTLSSVLRYPSPKTSDYLNLLLNGYTLFAFLSATPDVQRVTRKMFGTGEIWLDTSVVLPLLGEAAYDDDRRPFSAMMKQARLVGLKLYVTDEIIEEIERHINLCRVYLTEKSWRGQVPYLYTSYLLAGGKKERFSSWLERFAGKADPIQDVADYLSNHHGLRVESAANCEGLDHLLVQEIREIWREIHAARRGEEAFSIQTNRLAEHDSENYLHVLASRVAQRGKAPLGYNDWWLTLDHSARKILQRVSVEIRPHVTTGPVMSVDFLLRYLAFGPSRDRVELSGAGISAVYAGDIPESLPPDLLQLASQVREENSFLPEYVIRRRVRDCLNAEKARLGAIDAAGLSGARDVIAAAH